ncbi:MAG: LTA synthase family protein [Gammaproteobacteria bacterium]|nr:LTA synthase family protein [Gammaproteobacteria bacterium]
MVLITVESLSAEYLTHFGNKQNLTPQLNKLAKESLLFTNLYATGTRTVRGLEALTLSIPPTPGRSIVKRPDNEGVFSIGYIFRDHGYDTRFIYGGYGYFDNMSYFFENNGFDIVDRTYHEDAEIEFANIWGISDEDLFHRSLLEMDKSYKQGKPFFNLIMTTSNHRPFTYPEGRIDIPSHSGREGGVKYTDYAIGQFIEQARQKSWFNNTIFVIVADHCASSAGEAELQFNKYKIPLIIYAPAYIKPQIIDTLSSQIDVAPTIPGLLNFSYDSKFFGHDMLRQQKNQARALIGNYQKLGYLTNDRLTILSPLNGINTYQVDYTNGNAKKIAPVQTDIDEAITYYQSANLVLTKKLN